MQRLILDNISFLPVGAQPLGSSSTQAKIDTGADTSLVGLADAASILGSIIGDGEFVQISMDWIRGKTGEETVQRIVNSAPEKYAEEML